MFISTVIRFRGPGLDGSDLRQLLRGCRASHRSQGSSMLDSPFCIPNGRLYDIGETCGGTWRLGVVGVDEVQRIIACSQAIGDL